jgi:sulfur relay (sulfurtransferase) DsrC/TusE family protein
MPTASYGGRAVRVNDDGFLVDPGEWSTEMVAGIAKAVGIERLNEAGRF